ncbi:putative secreted protein [Solidesulfovibrio fructosivorans JJ]]|uniref:Putative secreted protein n=1 Tax=Solidesulfovibrio fructosivorans JJ] TaxID=596151 RepID=E1K2M7_SOLFR|nr:hypothetical protein [Solidesulfovibrio fructosivorans]EFL49128.1 putative secreted protein [Solidesulfovibrio fructosivorans JJ]]
MRYKALLTRALAAAVLLLAMASSVHAAELPAQFSQPPEKLADAFLRDLAAHVALTPQEKAAMRPILIEQIKKRQDLARTRLAANPGMVGMVALRLDLRSLAGETDARLAGVLPPEKMTRVRVYREERLKAARARVQMARHGGQGETF